MEFQTDTPIDLQIATDIKQQILKGALCPGDKMSSVREYSILYEVSPLTVQRALQQLELEGVIYARKGVGSFVNHGMQENLRRQMVAVQAAEFVTKMRNCGLTGAQIRKLVEQSLNEEGME